TVDRRFGARRDALQLRVAAGARTDPDAALAAEIGEPPPARSHPPRQRPFPLRLVARGGRAPSRKPVSKRSTARSPPGTTRGRAGEKLWLAACTDAAVGGASGRRASRRLRRSTQ